MSIFFFSTFFFFFFNDTATTEIYTLSLHDALPISCVSRRLAAWESGNGGKTRRPGRPARRGSRSEEHTSELQSHHDLVCRLLLEKKKKKNKPQNKKIKKKTKNKQKKKNKIK